MSRMWRTGLVVALVVAVCAAGSAGAAKFITGGDIKNGSIGLKDLSRATKRGLQGHAGPAGPAGATGPQGPAGPSSLSTTVRSKDFAAAADAAVTGEVRCPDGMVAVGGSVSPGEPMYVVSDVPSADGRGWLGTAHDISGIPGSLMRVTVICTPGTATVLPNGS